MAQPVLRLTRRSLLLGLAGAATLGACGGDAKPGAAGKKIVAQGPAQWLIPFFSTGENEKPILRTGVVQRMPFGLADKDGVPLSKIADKATFTISREDKPVGEPFDVSRYGSGTPFPYYPARVTFTTPGEYQIRTVVAGAAMERTVVVASPGDVDLVQPGERAIPVVTPTKADPRGVDPICTHDPPCPYHQLPLTEALTNGKPTILLVASPAYCQTNVCGPVLETLIEAEPKLHGMNVIHAEVYADAAAQQGDVLQATLTETVRAYRLSFEPSLLVIDAKGIVLDRLDFVFDSREFDAALDAAAGR